MMTRLLAKQSYIKVTRSVSLSGQRNEEEERFIFLYEDKIQTKYREFPLTTVLDLTYRLLAKESCILYIHTTQGVFSYQVRTSPSNFIEACKQQLKQVRIVENDAVETASTIQNVFQRLRSWFRKDP